MFDLAADGKGRRGVEAVINCWLEQSPAQVGKIVVILGKKKARIRIVW